MKPAQKAETTPFGVAPTDRRSGIGVEGGKGGGVMYVAAKQQATLVSEREIMQGVNADALIGHLDTLLPKQTQFSGAVANQWYALRDVEDFQPKYLQTPRPQTPLGSIKKDQGDFFAFLGSTIPSPKAELARGPDWYAMRSGDSIVDPNESVKIYLANAGIGDIPAVQNAEKNRVTLTIEEARATFEEIDKNHDAELSQIEYIKALRSNPEIAKRLGTNSHQSQQSPEKVTLRNIVLDH
jgi:hypothetical protein